MKISEIDLTALDAAHGKMNVLLIDKGGNVVLEIPWSKTASFGPESVEVEGTCYSYADLNLHRVQIVFRTIILS